MAANPSGESRVRALARRERSSLRSRYGRMGGENWEQTLLFADTVPQGLEAPDLFQDLRGAESAALRG